LFFGFGFRGGWRFIEPTELHVAVPLTAAGPDLCKVLLEIKAKLTNDYYSKINALKVKLRSHPIIITIIARRLYCVNDTIQYSPEAVRYPCTSCLLPTFDDAQCHVPATE